MQKRFIEPIIYKDAWHSELARMLIAVIIDVIFRPLIEAIDASELKTNAKHSSLEKALKDGSIQFTQGKFKGDINARISKELKELGAKWVRGYWRLPSPQLPAQLQAAIYANVTYMQRLSGRIDAALLRMPEILISMVKNVSLEGTGLENLNRISIKFKHRLNKLVSVFPDLGTEGEAKIRQAYIETDAKPIRLRLAFEFEDSAKRSLENFGYEEIANLRRELQELILGGRPRQEIRDLIQDRLKISATRCRFIARQETALLTTEFTKVQYLNAGIPKYQWVTVGDHIVRTKPNGGHAALNGNIYSWENPPDALHFCTGEPCHPGEDYNCRCQSKPLVEW